jgi:hypothetical protein
MKPQFSRQVFEKVLNIKFQLNSSSGEPICSMQTDGRTNVSKLIVAFRNFGHSPKKTTDFRRETLKQLLK